MSHQTTSTAMMATEKSRYKIWDMLHWLSVIRELSSFQGNFCHFFNLSRFLVIDPLLYHTDKIPRVIKMTSLVAISTWIQLKSPFRVHVAVQITYIGATQFIFRSNIVRQLQQTTTDVTRFLAEHQTVLNM